jgi:hypothetical protein
MRSDRRRSLATFVRNLPHGDLTLLRRITIFTRNIAIRATRRQGCCGHDGEPGC